MNGAGILPNSKPDVTIISGSIIHLLMLNFAHIIFYVSGQTTGLAMTLFLVGTVLGGVVVYLTMKTRMRRMRFHHIHVDEEREVSTDLQ